MLLLLLLLFICCLQVKLWRVVSEDTATTSLSTLASCSRVERIRFNQFAENILASCAGKQLTIHDVTTSQSIFSEEVSGDLIQSLSWDTEAKTLCVTGKDRIVRCIDPRAKEGSVTEVATFSVGKEFQVTN